MNVNVEIALTQAPTEREEQHMYEAAEFLTNNPQSIVITPSGTSPPPAIAECTMANAR